MRPSDYRLVAEELRKAMDATITEPTRLVVVNLAYALDRRFRALRGHRADFFSIVKLTAPELPADERARDGAAAEEDRGPVNGPGATLRSGDRVRLLRSWSVNGRNEPAGNELTVAEVIHGSGRDAMGDPIEPEFLFEGEDREDYWSLTEGDFERVDD